MTSVITLMLTIWMVPLVDTGVNGVSVWHGMTGVNGWHGGGGVDDLAGHTDLPAASENAEGMICILNTLIYKDTFFKPALLTCKQQAAYHAYTTPCRIAVNIWTCKYEIQLQVIVVIIPYQEYRRHAGSDCIGTQPPPTHPHLFFGRV